jgi:hypothetical protein
MIRPPEPVCPGSDAAWDPRTQERDRVADLQAVPGRLLPEHLQPREQAEQGVDVKDRRNSPDVITRIPHL